jgi:hypothetical protein
MNTSLENRVLDTLVGTRSLSLTQLPPEDQHSAYVCLKRLEQSGFLYIRHIPGSPHVIALLSERARLRAANPALRHQLIEEMRSALGC